MNFADYFETVKLRAAPLPTQLLNLKHAALGMVTEVGELADPFKRLLAYAKPLDSVNILEEVGDVMWYVVLWAIHSEITPEEFETSAAEAVEEPEFVESLMTVEFEGILATAAGIAGYFLLSTVDKETAETFDQPTAIQDMLGLLQAVLFRHGLTLSDCLDRNDAKLEARTGKKFDRERILNRDLERERQVLEGSGDPQAS